MLQPSQGVFVLPLWPNDREVPLPKQKARAIAAAAAHSAWVPLDKSVHRTGANFDDKSGQWICSGITCAFLVAAKQRRRLRACARVPGCTIIRATTEVSADAVPASKTTESRARVVKRVSDVVVVVTEMLGEQDDERLPHVGDVIQFSSGGIGYVIAVSDMCFAAALQNFSDPVAEGDRYFIMPKSLQPTVRLPQVGGAMIDVLGNGLDEVSAAKLSSADSADENEIGWFNEMVNLIQRQRINSPLHAGVMGLDAFVPIGRGQSMLLRLPPSVSSEQLPQFTSHIVRAQTGSNVRVVAAVATAEEGRKLQDLVANSGAEDQLVIVAGRSETPCLGESLLAMNAACAIAEAHRDAGGDALLLLNVEQLSQVWDLLCEVTDELGLEARTAKTQAEKNEPDQLPPKEMAVELWKYVARKNAMTARRRTFLGCFLQRAGRMADSLGGGSMTLLAFARLKDESTFSRAALEQKLQTVQAMQLDEALRAKAIAKVEAQLAEFEDASSATGVPEDFIEEAKAVTDGHVVFLDHTSGEGGAPRWCVDLQESVARGITADTVQNRPLHILKSLNLKMYLMAREEGNQVMECREDGSKLDNGPLLALMEQPVGDVLSVEDEAAFLLVALDDAKWAMDSFSLAEEILELLGKSRVRSVDEEASNKLVVGVRRWAETCWRKADKAMSLEDLSTSDIEDLSGTLGLKPLERKRVLAAFADPSSASAESSIIPSLAEDLTGRYQSMRKRLERVRSDPEMAKLLAGIGKSSIPDDELTDQLNTLMTRIAQGAGTTTTQ